MSEVNQSIISSIIETLVRKEASAFRKMIQKELVSRIHTKLEQIKKELSQDLLISQAVDDNDVSEATPVAPSAPLSTQRTPASGSAPGVIDIAGMPQKEPDPSKSPNLTPAVAAVKKLKPSEIKIVPTTAGSVRDDITLDPSMEKEFFIKSEKYKNQEITLKQIGTGLGRPIRAYINNRRWEFFPGPSAAMEASRSYVDQLMKDVRRNPELGMSMTRQIMNDRESGVAPVPAPADAGKPNEIADAELKRKQAENLATGGGAASPTLPQRGMPPAAKQGKKSFAKK